MFSYTGITSILSNHKMLFSNKVRTSILSNNKIMFSNKGITSILSQHTMLFSSTVRTSIFSNNTSMFSNAGSTSVLNNLFLNEMVWEIANNFHMTGTKRLFDGPSVPLHALECHKVLLPRLRLRKKFPFYPTDCYTNHEIRPSFCFSYELVLFVQIWFSPECKVL